MQQCILTRNPTQDWGFTLSRSGTHTTVSSVKPLSIAHLSELKVGDQIVSINGQMCARTTLTVLLDQIGRANNLALSFIRGGGTVASATPGTQATANTIRTGAPVIELVSDGEEDDDDEDDEEDDDDSENDYNRLMWQRGRSIFSDEEEDSEEEDSQDSIEEHNRQVERMWQRRQISTALAASRPTPSAPAARRVPIPYTPGEVVDLLSDDDEPARPTQPASSIRPAGHTTSSQAAPVSQAAAPLRTASTASAAQATTSGTISTATVTPAAPATTSKRSLDAANDATTTGETSAFKRRKVNCGGVEIKLEFEPKKFGEANQGDEVVEVYGEDDTGSSSGAAPMSGTKSSGSLAVDGVEAVVPASAEKANASAADDDDFEGDFMIVGNNMQVASDMPHQRYACTVHPYRVQPQRDLYGRPTETPHMLAERARVNALHCANCYCYVCDCKVAECLEWVDHCHATHKEAKWKLEKDARNSKILRLMAPPRRAAFFARYRDAFSVNMTTGRYNTGFFLEEDDDENAFLDADLNARLQTNALLPGGHQNTTRGKAGAVRDLTKTVDLLALARLKLHSSRASMSRDKFLEASELLLRAMVSPKHAGENPYAVGGTFLSWFLHPLCSSDVRGIVRSEVLAAASRSMVLNSTIFVALRELLNLPEEVIASLRSPPAAGSAVPPVPAAVVNVPDSLQPTLVMELMAARNFVMLKQLAQRKPALSHSLMVTYIRDGSHASCQEAVQLASQVNTQQRPFSTLRPSIQDVALDKLLRFVATGIAYNVSHPRIPSAPWALSNDCIDMVFGIILASLLGGLTSYASVPCDGVAQLLGEAESHYKLTAAPTWVDLASAGDRMPQVVLYLYVAYTNWRALNATETMGPVQTLAANIVTPAVFSGLRAPALFMVANLFRRHFTPSWATEQTCAGLNAATLLACNIAQRALPTVSASVPLSYLDAPIRAAWMSIPILRKSKAAEICSSSGPVKQVVAPDNAQVTDLLELRFCPAVRPANCALNVPNPSSRRVAALSPRIAGTYCDLHYTYDTFLMCLAAPKNVTEIATAQACWGHSLGVSDALHLLRLLQTVPATDDDNITTTQYITYLMKNREVAMMVWKSILKHLYSYMHAQCLMDNRPLIQLLQQLSVALQPWLSGVDAVKTSALAAHADCQGLTSEQLAELQSVDLVTRMVYHFGNLMSKYDENGGGAVFSVADVRSFKAAVLRLEHVGTDAKLAEKLCQMFLLEYPIVSTRAVWHSFWRRFLQSFVSKMTPPLGSQDGVAVETQAVLLLLEDWGPLKELTAKAATQSRQVINFISALARLQKTDFTTLNYGAVSGTMVLKNALDPIAQVKFAVPVGVHTSPLSHISEQCMENPESGLVHLTLQLSMQTLELGALDFQPYFALALQKRVDAALAAAEQPGPSQQSALQLVMRAYEDCVGLVSSPARNPHTSYVKVLSGCVALRRLDLVGKLVAAGFANVLYPVLPDSPRYGEVRAQALCSVLLAAHSQAEFEQLLEVLDSFVAEAYTDVRAVDKMGPIIRKYCASATFSLGARAIAPGSLWAKQLLFYHNYDADSFFLYWNSVPAAGKPTATERLLSWTKKLEGTSRFRADMHISILSQTMARSAFAAYLGSTELDKPGFDKFQVLQAVVKIISADASAAVELLPVLVRILFSVRSLTPSVRATLLSICNTQSLPATQQTVDATRAYTDARSLLLYLGNPDAHAQALSEVYAARYGSQERDGMCRLLLDRDNPDSLLKLLLSARDYPQLFWALRDLHSSFTATTMSGKAVALAPTAVALEKLRTSLAINHVYNAARVGAGASNASLSVFQKELFDNGSFVVCLADFLLFLQAEHLDNRVVSFPSPLGGVLEGLLDKVKQLTHNDVIVSSYLRAHLYFNHLSTFFNDCLLCKFDTVPYTPADDDSAGASTPSTLCVDVARKIAQAPKYSTVTLALISQLYGIAVRSPKLLPSHVLSDLVRGALNSPCTYHKENHSSFEVTAGGLLSLPKPGSNGAFATVLNELVKMLNERGAPLSAVLVEPLMRRLVGDEVDYSLVGTTNTSPQRGKVTIQQWGAAFPEELRKVVNALAPAGDYLYLVGIFALHGCFHITTLQAHGGQGLASPYAAQFRQVLFNLALYAIVTRKTTVKMLLPAITAELHHPNNTFAPFFLPSELDTLARCMCSNEELKYEVCTALAVNNDSAGITAKTLLKIPKLLDCLNKNFAHAYESFAALYHAMSYLPLWIDIAQHGTELSAVVLQQAMDCFRAIVDACRTSTVNARTRGLIEQVMPSFQKLFVLFPDREKELNLMKQEAKVTLKSKQQVVKAMAVLN